MNKNFAVIDGSYNPEKHIYGCGGFLIDQMGNRYEISDSGSDPELAKMRNVAGEILGAENAINLARYLHMKELTIFHDYKGIACWPLGLWKATKPGTINYVNIVKKAMNSGLKLYFHHVKAHSGDPGNEEADKLAKLSVI